MKFNKEIDLTKKKKIKKPIKKIIKKNTTKNTTKISIETLLKTGKNDCKPFFFNKEGFIIRSNKKIDRVYRDFICVIKGKKTFDKIDFPYLYGTENMILKKLLIIKKAQDENLQYRLTRKVSILNGYPDTSMYVFKSENLDKSLYLSFLNYIKNIDESFYREFSPKDETKEENIIKYFATFGIDYKLTFSKISNDEILTLLFYVRYIFFIQKDIIKKYGYSLKDFNNYHQLYLFLKINGYVKLFFQKYGPRIIKLIPIYIKKINKHPLFKSFVEDVRIKDVLNFKDLSIYDLIDEYVPEYINKKELWKKYKNLIK